MKRTAYLTALVAATVLVGVRYAAAGQVRALPPILTFRSATAIASTPPSSSPTQSRSPIRSTILCSASSDWATHCRRASVRFIAANCRCTA